MINIFLFVTFECKISIFEKIFLMGLDIKKLKHLQDKIHNEAIKEIYGELPINVIQLLNNNILNYCLHEYKSGIKQNHAIRVVNSWLAQDVIKIKDEDRGKMRRFDRIENIWLNVVFEARKFGVSLESLKELRKNLLESPIKNFSKFKLGVIQTLFSNPQVLVFPTDGIAQMYSIDSYNAFTKTRFPAHTAFRLEDYISLEYPNNALSVDFKISNSFEDKNKMLLLYFLKTGDFEYMKVYIKEGDIRGIENPNTLFDNKELMDIISNWKFQKVDIIINNEVETTINK